MLEQEEITAAEVAYKVGFGSPAYFNRCFHEYFGYPPGEAKNRNNSVSKENNGIINNHSADEAQFQTPKKTVRKIVVYTAGGILVLFMGYLLFNNVSLKNFSILPGNRLKSEDKSIAIIPFKSLSSDEENQYFTEGVTRNILYNLIQISEIKVINRPIEELAGNTFNLTKMAGRLNVRFFLSGSVQKSGEQVLVIAQLTDVTKNQIVWSEKYDRKLLDIFMIQSEIANQVATNLQSVITKKENEQIRKKPTQNMEAHAWYTMGRYLLSRRGWRWDNVDRYINPFEKAIAADPEYAEAYAGLAEVYLTVTISFSYPTPEGFIKAKYNVEKALKLDNDLSEAHATHGAILYWYEWNWEKAKEELELAMDLNPNNATAHKYFAELMIVLRQNEMARSHILKAAELDPVSPYIMLRKARILCEEGKYNEALEECSKFIEMYPDIYSVYFYLWDFYRIMGKDYNKDAVESLQKAYIKTGEERIYVDSIKLVYDKYGMTGLEHWNFEHDLIFDEQASWILAAEYYNKIGENEKALDWIEKAFKWRIPNLPGINAISELDSLRNEPRFQALIDSMGLSAYQ